MAHRSPFAADPVCVTRMTFASTGGNWITVVGVAPAPSLTGLLHELPSIDTCTLYAIGPAIGIGGPPRPPPARPACGAAAAGAAGAGAGAAAAAGAGAAPDGAGGGAGAVAGAAPRPGAAAGAPRPPRPRPPNVKGSAVSIWTSVTTAGCGSSIWNHMPGCCGAPAVSQRAPGTVPAAFAAASALWLAERRHSAALVIALGSEASSSGSVHGVLRAVFLRTKATWGG